jgi:hypothetical protein
VHELPELALLPLQLEPKLLLLLLVEQQQQLAQGLQQLGEGLALLACRHYSLDQALPNCLNLSYCDDGGQGGGTHVD